jgi:hypothetical protein
MTILRVVLAADREPVCSWVRNPALRADFGGLVQGGFATCGESPLGPTLALTPAALERLAAHLVPVGVRVVHVEHLEDAPAAVARAREVAP